MKDFSKLQQYISHLSCLIKLLSSCYHFERFDMTKFFSGQIFFWPKFFSGQNLFDPNFFSAKIFLTQIFFSGHQKFWPNFLWILDLESGNLDFLKIFYESWFSGVFKLQLGASIGRLDSLTWTPTMSSKCLTWTPTCLQNEI